MNSPIPGEFYLFLPSRTLSEVASFPRSFPRLWALRPARLLLDSRPPGGGDVIETTRLPYPS